MEGWFGKAAEGFEEDVKREIEEEERKRTEEEEKEEEGEDEVCSLFVGSGILDNADCIGVYHGVYAEDAEYRSQGDWV